MKIKKYYKKALAIGTAIGGILMTDQIVKATRKVGKYNKHKTARMITESTIQVAGALAWMGVASALWNADSDKDLTNDQVLTHVREYLVNILTDIKEELGKASPDLGRMIEPIYDIEEVYESGRLYPNELDAMKSIHQKIVNGESGDVTGELEALIARVSSGEMSLVVPEEEEAVQEEPTAVKGIPADEYLEKIANSMRKDLRAGKISAIDAVSTVMDAMEKAGIDDEEAESKLTDEFAEIEAQSKPEPQGNQEGVSE